MGNFKEGVSFIQTSSKTTGQRWSVRKLIIPRWHWKTFCQKQTFLLHLPFSSQKDIEKYFGEIISLHLQMEMVGLYWLREARDKGSAPREITFLLANILLATNIWMKNILPVEEIQLSFYCTAHQIKQVVSLRSLVVSISSIVSFKDNVHSELFYNSIGLTD